jgi:branched-chain amino acid transport system permease protein
MPVVFMNARRVFIVSAVGGCLALFGAAAAHAATTTTTVPGTSITGALTVDGKPVPGVRISASRAAKEIARATSDAQGAWTLTVPGPGHYRLALDPKSLPSGVRVERAVLPDFQVFGSFAQHALFTLSSGRHTGPSGPSTFDDLLNLFVSGIRFGLIIGLCSVGLSVIYATTGLVNFAHGEIVTFGALVAWFFNTMTSGPRISLVLAAMLGFVFTGLLGAGIELGIFRPMARLRTGAIARMLVSIGLALFLRYLYQVIFTGNPRSFRQYSAQSPIEFGPLEFPIRDYAVMAISIVALVAVGVALQRTRLGTAIRAVSDEHDLASVSGIDARRVVLIVWMGGAALAGLGGVLLGVSQSVQWNMGFRLLLTMFAAVVLGGLGNPFGAMVGGLVVGVASQVSTYWLPSDFQFAIALIILILVLLVRPQGILGVRERIG